jgi:hypothetical protein
MSIFIKKKFIGDNEVDGAKVLMLNNQAVRAENASGAAVELFKLDSSNVLQFVQMPQVSADPTSGNQLARKSYVDAQDAAEAAARAAAVSGLEAAVDAEEARALAAEAALQSEIDAEESARAAAVSAEASARQAADAAEAAARAAADTALQEAIDAEEARAIAAEAALQGEIDAEESARAAAVSAEAAAREAADSALDARLDSLELDSVTKSYVDTEVAGAKSYTDQKVADLVASAPAVLDTLKELADALGEDPNFATTVAGQIGAEQAAREAADSALQSEIDAEEMRALTAEGALQSEIDAEEAARIAADEALDGRLDSLEADSVTKSYVDSQDALKLDLAGGTMSGDITMDGNAVKFRPFGMMGQEVKFGTITVPGPFGPVPAFGVDAGNNDVRISTSTAVKVEIPYAMGAHEFELSGIAAKINFPEVVLGNGSNSILLKGVAQPVSDTDGANKIYVDTTAGNAAAAAALTEQERAIAAEAALQMAIDDLESDLAGETAARESADSGLQSAIEAEEARATGAEAALQAEIDAEEVRAAAAEAALEAAIDAEEARAIAAEAAVEAAAEAYTDAAIAALKGSVSGSYDSLKKIEDKIEFIVQNTDPAALDSLAEIVTAFQGADGSINAAISALAASASADLDAEEAARIAADSAEASARQSADAALDARIDVLEADPTTKTYVDAQVASEAAARIAGDAVLQSAIDALEASTAAFQPAAPEVFTLSSTDIANQYIELSVTAVVANSVEVRVNRMFALPSEFTQSSGTAGKVRLSFAGALATGGQQALVAGDTLVVRFWVS